jgi:hypothetical protein
MAPDADSERMIVIAAVNNLPQFFRSVKIVLVLFTGGFQKFGAKVASSFHLRNNLEAFFSGI